MVGVGHHFDPADAGAGIRLAKLADGGKRLHEAIFTAHQHERPALFLRLLELGVEAE